MPIDTTTPGGISGSHPVLEGGAAKVGPSTGSEKNTVATLLIPLGCWRVEDMRFQFDSSFVLPGIMTEIPLLKKLREDHTLRVPGGAAGAEKLIPPPVSLFGHADPVGSDVYNKELSGRRAMAIYGLLTRDIAMWEKLFSHAHSQGGDQWGDASLTTMLEVTDPTTATDEAHRDSELADHRGSAGKRATLFQNYMDKITAGFKLEKSDFLGQGADSKGKADYQGCGEFNPVKLFSEEDEKEFQKPENKEVRNVGNGPNRRVMALLFRPGTQVDPKKWPCPRAEEPGAGCIKRFWSDGEKRRSKHLPGEERLFEETHDTFGCRFYHRLAASSPCEKVLPRLTATLEVVADSNDDTTVDASEAATDFVRVGLWDHAFEAATGNLINTSDDKKNFIGQDSKGKEARRFYFRVTDPNAKGQAQVRVNWRTEFGAGGDDDAPASQVISLLADQRPGGLCFQGGFPGGRQSGPGTDHRQRPGRGKRRSGAAEEGRSEPSHPQDHGGRHAQAGYQPGGRVFVRDGRRHFQGGGAAVQTQPRRAAEDQHSPGECTKDGGRRPRAVGHAEGGRDRGAAQCVCLYGNLPQHRRDGDRSAGFVHRLEHAVPECVGGRGRRPVSGEVPLQRRQPVALALDERHYRRWSGRTRSSMPTISISCT